MARPGQPGSEIQDVAHLAHVELLSPRPEATVRFFTELLGLFVTARSGQSVYLRAWGDHYHHSVKVTESPRAGLGHVAWRAWSDEALERRVSDLEETEFGQGWIDGDLGHGRAYRFTDPAGHRMELFFEVEKARAPAGEAPRLKNRPMRVPVNGPGISRIDHVNLFTQDVPANREFLQARLGFRHREGIVHDDLEIGAWLSVTPLVHDIAYTFDRQSEVRGRLHHVAYWADTFDGLARSADLMREHDIFIEAGPGKHAITNALFLYCYEPGGNRVELFTGGYLIFDPDWQPVIWTKEERELRMWWGGRLPESFHTYGTPQVDA
ncbi:catechol 2,3-dioxygenase [Limnochorda pilosa]|uniref:Metapyrocatechase n=1 Tax=Limnochorda pilosa TaxID=1555112 RepID=A0A0K2SMF0_LIMPI|nr:catechol 2,3-dioxygenase [Limnochorda pilosa]BAS28009.1 catechol 2,3 dioxygenase [Limnochorda pilosa]